MQLKRHTRSTRNVNASVENWYAFDVNLHAFVVKPARVHVRVHACIRTGLICTRARVYITHAFAKNAYAFAEIAYAFAKIAYAFNTSLPLKLHLICTVYLNTVDLCTCRSLYM